MRAPNINTLWAAAFVDELARNGLRDAVIAPGSRSTPLVVAFAGHESIRDYSVIDERQAAFFALGLARATGRPVALICTSGTAAANFFPAICEACRDGVPLLVLTADRPAELQDCGASQAMNQIKLYGDHVRAFYQVAQAEGTAEKLRYLRSLASRAHQRALGPQPGPVHLNMPFRKPLEPLEVEPGHRDAVPRTLLEEAPVASGGRPNDRPYLEIALGRMELDEDSVAAFVATIAKARRPLILAGADPRGKGYADALCDFARAWGAPVLAEATSGLRYGARAEEVLSIGDFLFESRFYQGLARPDCIIRTGRAPLLWSAQKTVRAFADVPQFGVSASVEVADPDHLLSGQLICDEAAFFEAAAPLLTESAAAQDRQQWLSAHRTAHHEARGALTRALEQECVVTTAHLWERLGEVLPDNAALFVSNSMPLRDLDTFLVSTIAPVEVFVNRGLNGIDGILSTGLGVAAAGFEPTVIVTGDVALRHDIGGLLLASELDLSVTVVVCDNGGGAIFDYLPIAGFEDVHERHFATSARETTLTSTKGQYFEPTSVVELDGALREALALPGLKVICLKTTRHQEKELRESLRRRVAAAIDECSQHQERETI